MQQMCSSFCLSQISHFDETQFIYYNCSSKQWRVVELGVQKMNVLCFLRNNSENFHVQHPII